MQEAPYRKSPSPSTEGQGPAGPNTRSSAPPFGPTPPSGPSSQEHKRPAEEVGGGSRLQPDVGLLTPAMILGADQAPMLGEKAEDGTCLRGYNVEVPNPQL